MVEGSKTCSALKLGQDFGRMDEWSRTAGQKTSIAPAVPARRASPSSSTELIKDEQALLACPQTKTLHTNALGKIFTIAHAQANHFISFRGVDKVVPASAWG
jgi:hypothetical protein